ncbi:MAG: glucosamine-6-phosphate deaminase [Clostridia bacterium]
MKIILTKNYEELSQKAAEIIVSQVNSKPNSVLGLATGSTPVGTYKKIIKMYNDSKVDFSDIKTVNLDEYRGLDKSSDQTYYHFMNENFFQFVNVSKENTHIPDGTNLDADAECEKYEQTILDLGGIDLQLLGIGHNGHIGFNEPDDSFATKTHCVTLDESTIKANARFFESEADVPTQAYTMGIGTIMSAKKILLVATGESKADILFETVLGDVRPQTPSTILHMHHDVTIVADEAALSKILKICPQIVTK